MKKCCMMTGMASAMIAAAATAAFLCGSCAQSKKARITVNHAMKHLSHAIDDMM